KGSVVTNATVSARPGAHGGVGDHAAFRVLYDHVQVARSRALAEGQNRGKRAEHHSDGELLIEIHKGSPKTAAHGHGAGAGNRSPFTDRVDARHGRGRRGPAGLYIRTRAESKINA